MAIAGALNQQFAGIQDAFIVIFPPPPVQGWYRAHFTKHAPERIEALLRELPAVTRDTFLLSQIEGLTYVQIAERLDVSLITVKRHMRAAFIACLSVA